MLNPIYFTVRIGGTGRSKVVRMNAFRHISVTEQLDSSPTRRSKLELEIDILTAIGAGADRPTRIMYRSNLSWSIMQSFMKELQRQDLIRFKLLESKRHYYLTSKGTRVVKTYLSVRKQLDELTP